ncbi:hypothetical protein Tco_1252437 [Tanacetum coccineum]
MNTHLILPLLHLKTTSSKQPSTGAETSFPTPHDSPLHVVHSHGHVMQEARVKIGKARKRAKVVLSEDDEDVR